LLQRAGARIKYDKKLMWFKIRGQQRLKPIDIEIPGDFSSASFLLGAGAITDSRVRVLNLDYQSVQGDRAIVDYLRELGTEVEVERNAVTVHGADLSGTDFDCSDTPDLVPVLAVLGAIADGETRIQNVPHLRIKESDRIRTLSIGLEKLGARVKELEDGLVVIGVRELQGNIVDSFNDHRIAMALAVAGLVAKGETVVENAECVSVSYPSFVRDMRKLGARIKLS
jgi:3-phosphoshikimate 1-carboxyvinyltransferase